MTKIFKITDFENLAVNIRSSLVKHEIPDELHYSIISDVLFDFAAYIDEKTNDNLHEVIDSYLEDHTEKILSDEQEDYLLADIEIIFEKGRKIKTNVLFSCLKNKEYGKLVLEVAVGVRDISELDKDVDIDSRFEKLMKKKEGVVSVNFQPLKDLDTKNWLSIPLVGSEYGDFEQSIDGIFNLICKVAKQWA